MKPYRSKLILSSLLLLLPMAVGLLFLVNAWLLLPWLLLPVILLVVFVPVIYSYCLYKKGI